MSIEARKAIVDHPHTFFQNNSQRGDLLDPNRTRTELIALLTELLRDGFNLVFTAIRTDHHDDSGLGLHCHAFGYCADVWPLNTPRIDDYVDAQSPHFEDFLEAVASSSWLYQVGLAGSADTGVNRSAAGRSVFSDDGADHIHLGAI